MNVRDEKIRRGDGEEAGTRPGSRVESLGYLGDRGPSVDLPEKGQKTLADERERGVENFKGKEKFGVK